MMTPRTRPCDRSVIDGRFKKAEEFLDAARRELFEAIEDRTNYGRLARARVSAQVERGRSEQP